MPLYLAHCSSSASVTNTTTGVKSGLCTASATATALTAIDAETIATQLSLTDAISKARSLIDTKYGNTIVTDSQTTTKVDIVDDSINLTYVTMDSLRSRTKNVTDNNEYSGYSTLLGKILKDGKEEPCYFNYVGGRTPKTNGNQPLFTETLNILKDPDNFISAIKTYKDDGSTNVTTVPSNVFLVTCGSGIFEDFKYIKVTYNSDKSRDVVCYK